MSIMFCLAFVERECPSLATRFEARTERNSKVRLQCTQIDGASQFFFCTHKNLMHKMSFMHILTFGDMKKVLNNYLMTLFLFWEKNDVKSFGKNMYFRCFFGLRFWIRFWSVLASIWEPF